MLSSKKLCIIHGNCQGETLTALLGASPEFMAAYEVEYYVNFTRQAIPSESLARCGLLLHQHLGEEWGDLSSASLRAALGPGARSLCIPNMLFKGYWPFWSSKPGFDYSDMMLDSLLERGLGKDEAMLVAVRGNLDQMFGLEALLRETLAVERGKERLCDVQYVDIIEERFRKEKLFMSVNHPGRTLMLHAADAVLGKLGMPGLPESYRQAYPEVRYEFELPIHPQVAGFHRLEFVPEGAMYTIYGHPMTYVEYIGLYLDCKLAGRSDFIRYLQGR